MAEIAVEETLSTYGGQPQPPINERLGQIYNFLADEDYYRCVNFTSKFHDIKSYIQDLEIGDQKEEPRDQQLLNDIKGQIDVHEHWIQEATKITPFNFNSPRLIHPNRIMKSSWKPRVGLISSELEDVQTYVMDPCTPEAKLHVTLQEDDGKQLASEPDPFEYTKKLVGYRELRLVKAQSIKNRHEGNDALAFNPLERGFEGPWAPPSAEKLLLQWKEKMHSLLDLAVKLTAAHEKAPRAPLTQILNVLRKICSSSKPATTLLKANDFTSADETKLLILTGRSYHRSKPSHLVGPHANFVNRIKSLIRRGCGFWPEGLEEPVKVDDLINKVISMGKLNLDRDTMIRLLELMNEDGNLRYITNSDEVRAPLPNEHPECRVIPVLGQWRFEPARITQSEWIYLGFRLAVAIMKTTTQVRRATSENGYMNQVMTEYANDLAKRTREWEKEVVSDERVPSSLPAIATPLVPESASGELTEEIAIGLLQEKITDESNKNLEERADPESIWGWTPKRDLSTEEIFSARGWSPKTQHSGDLRKENMFLEWVSKQKSAAKAPTGHYTLDWDGQMVYQLPKQKQFFPGNPIMPFGETIEQEQAISRRIDEHLRELKDERFAGIYGPKGSYTLSQQATRDVNMEAVEQSEV